MTFGINGSARMHPCLQASKDALQVCRRSPIIHRLQHQRSAGSRRALADGDFAFKDARCTGRSWRRLSSKFGEVLQHLQECVAWASALADESGQGRQEHEADGLMEAMSEFYLVCSLPGRVNAQFLDAFVAPTD